jgi:hypothetical protein
MSATAHRLQSEQETIGVAPSNVRRLRQNKRSQTNITAVLITDQYTSKTEIRNLSVTGAGIRCTGPVKQGAQVTVELPDGRRLLTLVRWHRMGFCGIEFLEALAEDDVLFAGIASANLVPANRFPCPADEQGRRQVVAVPVGSATPPPESMIKKAFRPFFVMASRQRSRITAYNLSKRQQREKRMVERACRKQGFSWLVD